MSLPPPLSQCLRSSVSFVSTSTYLPSNVYVSYYVSASPDKPGTLASQCAQTFLYSTKSLDPTPKNAESRMRIMPKMKTKHEGEAVMGNDQVSLVQSYCEC